MKRDWFWFLALMLVAAVGGCSAYQPVQLEPLRKAPPVAPRFTQSYYYYDQDQNLYFVMRSHTTDQPSGTPIDQVATIRVFWRPRGGVTTLEPSALNATFRYIVMTPDAVGMYEGAGFVRLSSKTGAAKFEGRITDGDMRLTQASAAFVDTLGRAHIRGYFSATFDDVKAVDALLAVQREFFDRSLASKPKAVGVAATVPAASMPAASMPFEVPPPASAPAAAAPAAP